MSPWRLLTLWVPSAEEASMWAAARLLLTSCPFVQGGINAPCSVSATPPVSTTRKHAPRPPLLRLPV
eukprot:6740158-Pyramimonas_sp.AAC.1